MTLENLLYIVVAFVLTELYWKNGLKSVSLNVPNMVVAANVLSWISISVALGIYGLVRGGDFAGAFNSALVAIGWFQSIGLVVSLYRAASPGGKKGRK
jgi:hypothetical protein